MDYIEKEYEKDKKKLEENWALAIGLQKVDNLEPSEYLIEIAHQNIEGQISYQEVHQLLYSHYEQMPPEALADRKKECDFVSAKIADYLSNYSFSLAPETYRAMHEYLFCDINAEIAGKFRRVNLTKEEAILGGRSVIYADWRMIQETLAYDFKEERSFEYRGCDKKALLKRLSTFIADIWQVHPFREGNTRTTALFLECYLNTLGFAVNNNLFARKARYFRNALVRANYTNIKMGIYSDSTYLAAFLENLIFDGNHQLHNRDLMINELIC